VAKKIENNKNRLKKDLIAQIKSWKTKLDQIAEVRNLIASMKSLIEGTMRFLDQMEERC
jgi:hypothetical protein